MSVEKALQRPINYSAVDTSEQYRVDKKLGILDWEPTAKEAREYSRKRSEMGDPEYTGLDNDIASNF